ncbi:Translation protein SH3-like domain superfamily [Sesbania bispinosa]|nr:Translation protein SH3-like domain superfamily [Sesbania bispinosa]
MFVGVDAFQRIYGETKDKFIARKLFNKIPQRSVDAWNSMISGYKRNRFANEAIELFHKMCESGFVSDPATIVSVSSACSQLGSKCPFVGIDIFTAKKLEGIVPSSHNYDVPHVNRTDYQLIDISKDGFVSFLIENGLAGFVTAINQASLPPSVFSRSSFSFRSISQMETPMEFWGVEVKVVQSVKVDPTDELIGYIHISQVALGEAKKGKTNEYDVLYLKVDDQKFVLGTLTRDDIPQLSMDLVLDKFSELSHNSRNAHYVRGLWPSTIFTQELQEKRLMHNLHQYEVPLHRYMAMMDLQERNERLFYKLLIDNVEELLPIVYTPTVGEACQKYGSIFRRPQGLYISLKKKGGVRPSSCLPVMIDVGTNNEKLQNDEFYIGVRQKRVTWKEYQELLAPG